MAMQNRAEIIDQNFQTILRENKFPPYHRKMGLQQTAIKHFELVDLFESQLMSRLLDIRARELKAQGESFYTIGSAGHEGNAVLGHLTEVTDMAFLHYRSAPFMIQRAKKAGGQSILWDLLLSLTASSEDPISAGRHKVLGNLKLNIPPQTSTIASHLPKSIGMALSITRTKALGIESSIPGNALAYCSFGDASLNHSTALGAINSAEWIAYQNIPLPLLFVCEDNQTGISVKTPDNWVASVMTSRPVIRYFSCDGLDLIDSYLQSRKAIQYVRQTKRPAFLHFKTVRLMGHAGSDIETTYRSLREIEATEEQDPLLQSAQLLIENKILSSQQILDLYSSLRERIVRISEHAIKRPKLQNAEEVMASILPPTQGQKNFPQRNQLSREEMFDKEWKQQSFKQPMNKLINWTLMDLLHQYPNTVLFGEDVAKKGGVYHITNGLMKRFGQKRVFNSLLDEQTILGTAIGFAHNRICPIAEIQFLAYVHNAEDQIRGEAATLSFFSNGQFHNGMLIRIPGLAYQKGFGGHFHNDNSLAVFRDIPGLVLACPSNGEEAVKMLRTSLRLAQEEGKVVIFIEPIALYMTRDLIKKDDGLWTFNYPPLDQEDSLGDFSVIGEGRELCLITYGNGHYMCQQALHKIHEKGFKTTLINLKWLSHIDYQRLMPLVERSKNILIVDECRKTGSLSETLMTEIFERSTCPLKIKRVTAQDSFVPLGNATRLIMPQTEDIIEAAFGMLR